MEVGASIRSFTLCLWVLMVAVSHLVDSAMAGCVPSSCGHIHNISSPFRLHNDPKGCGDSRYSLSCENNVTLILHPTAKSSSAKFYVQAINYNNRTIRAVDPGIQKNNCSSIPSYSLSYAALFKVPYYDSIYEIPTTTVPVYFLKCTNPVNDSLYLDTAPCFNSSQPNTHGYAKVKITTLRQLTGGCSIEGMTYVVLAGGWDASYKYIHNAMLYGFELRFSDRRPYVCGWSVHNDCYPRNFRGTFRFLWRVIHGLLSSIFQKSADVLDQSWRRLTERQEKEIRWIREHISIVLRRSTVLLNRYSLDQSGLAPAPEPFIYQYRRYRTLRGDSSMVRERNDFYQLKKAVGDEPVPEPEVEVVAAADAPGADAGAVAEPVPQRKKKKAKRARSGTGTEVDAGDDSGVPQAAEVPAESAAADPPRTAREEVREHRKKQKVQAAVSADQVAEGACTALSTQSTGAGLVFGRTVQPQNAQLFNGAVYKALTDPLPVDHLVSYPELSVMRQREVLFQCKQKLAYEEQLLDRRYWKELQTASQGVVSIQSAYDNLVREKEEVEAKLARAEEEAGRKLAEVEEKAAAYAREVEEKAKSAVASETARMQAEFDKRLEAALDRANNEAVLAYRRDRQRAVEQTTAFIEGGVYILGKIKDAFPGQDWSQLPVPTVTDDLVDDEHTAILHEIEEEIGCSSVQG